MCYIYTHMREPQFGSDFRVHRICSFVKISEKPVVNHSIPKPAFKKYSKNFRVSIHIHIYIYTCICLDADIMLVAPIRTSR